MVRAHQHAAGAIRGELDPNSELSAIEQVQQREALGWSKGGFSSKIHDPVYDQTESVATRATVVTKYDFICDGVGFDIRFHVRSMSIEEVSLTKLSTVCGTWLSYVLTA